MTNPVMKQMRIIQVVNVRWFNATAWYGLFLSRLLRDAGHQVLVLGLPGTESFVKAVEMGLSPLAVNLNTANPLEFSRTVSKVAGIVRDFAPQVVNCHRGEGFLLWGLLRAIGYPFALVRTRGDQRPPRGNLPNKILYRNLADALIATNSATAGELISMLECDSARVHTVLGGVDTGKFRHDAEGRARVRAEFGFSDDDIVVGLLGRFDFVKGQQELIEALGRIHANEQSDSWRRRIRLMLMGFPTSLSQEAVETTLAAHSMTECTVITGKRPDVTACISAMDLGVVASQGSEAIARAAFEIMSCGVPLLSTRIGVMPDILPEWALVPPGDADALVRALEWALCDPQHRRRLREAALQRIATLSEQDFLRQTMQVYIEAWERRFPPISLKG